eukprot:1540075-Rhodomonas_salina.1
MGNVTQATRVMSRRLLSHVTAAQSRHAGCSVTSQAARLPVLGHVTQAARSRYAGCSVTSQAARSRHTLLISRETSPPPPAAEYSRTVWLVAPYTTSVPAIAYTSYST